MPKYQFEEKFPSLCAYCVSDYRMETFMKLILRGFTIAIRMSVTEEDCDKTIDDL